MFILLCTDYDEQTKKAVAVTRLEETIKKVTEFLNEKDQDNLIYSYEPIHFIQNEEEVMSFFNK